MTSGWHSLHIFIHDFGRIDEFVRRCLVKLPQHFWNDAFFIRYWEGGPHVRLRYHDYAHNERILMAIREDVEAHGFPSNLTPDAFYPIYEKHYANDSGRVWYENGSIHSIDYQPELDRYGGATGMSLCETFFTWDSAHVLSCMDRNPATTLDKVYFGYCLVSFNALRRLGLVPFYLSHFALPGSIDASAHTEPAFSAFRRQRPALAEVWRTVASRHYYAEWVQPFYREIAALAGALLDAGIDDVSGTIDSILHMSFNRTGISPSRERNIRFMATQIDRELSGDCTD